METKKIKSARFIAWLNSSTVSKIRALFFSYLIRIWKRLKRRTGIGTEEKDMKRDLGEGQGYRLERSRKAEHKRQFANLTAFLSIDIVENLLSNTPFHGYVVSSLLNLAFSSISRIIGKNCRMSDLKYSHNKYVRVNGYMWIPIILC